MNKEIEFLENSVGELYDALSDATDEQTKIELKSAISSINEKIEALYDSAPKASKGNDPDRSAARREGKADTKGMLKRISAAGGREALDFALNLPPEMSNEEIERVATRAAKSGALSHQRSTVAALPQPRLPSEQAEQSWLREARESAERAWAVAMGRPMPQRDLRTAEQIALHESFGELAARAAGLTHTEDGQKIFRTSRPDAEDERLFLAGEASARRIWPGR